MTENTQQLETILNELMKGHLTLAAYRQKRARYIHEFMQSCEKDNTQRMTQIKRPVAADVSSQPNTQPLSIPKVVNQQSSLFSQVVRVMLVVAIIGVGATTWYFSSQLNTEAEISTVEEALQSSSNSLENDENIEQTVGLFVFKFLAKDQWNSNALSDFLVQWQALSRKQQNTLRKTPSFIQLRDTLRQRINEQQALQATDSRAKQQENLLIWFSTQLSISV